MSWWDRFKSWWLAVADTKVVGPGAPGKAPWVLSEADRAWLRGAADAVDQAARVEWPGAVMVEITITDELARSVSARLREMAG